MRTGKESSGLCNTWSWPATGETQVTLGRPRGDSESIHLLLSLLGAGLC